MACGIYIMRFNGTNKVYIGQSLDIESRKVQHNVLMRTNKASKKVQEAYHRYGAPSIGILDECMPEELDLLEDEYILLYNSVDNGFNTRTNAGGGSSLPGEMNGNAKYSNSQICSSLLLLIRVPKLSYPEISSITGVSRAMLAEIAAGSSHRWLSDVLNEEYSLLMSFRNCRNTRLYPPIKSPTGEIFEVKHLSKFCEEHGLDTGNLSKVLTGKKKQYLGWYAIPQEK
jgi:hypothetical protein